MLDSNLNEQRINQNDLNQNQLFNDIEENLSNIGNFIDNYNNNFLPYIEKNNEELIKSITKFNETKKKMKEQFYINILGFTCCLKSKYKKEKDKIKNIKNKEKENFEKKIDKIMKAHENKINKKKYNLFIISFFSFSFIHFLGMSEIHGFLFSLFGEIKRSLYYYIKEDYNTYNTFDYFFTVSIFTDTSQINLSYLSCFN